MVNSKSSVHPQTMTPNKYGTIYRWCQGFRFFWQVTEESSANIVNSLGLYKYRKHAQLPDSLAGKIVLITGANTGIGKETAKVVASKGAHVIMACRDEGRAQKAVDDIVNELSKEELRKSFTVVLMDLGNLDSVRSAAEQVNRQFTHLDVLINNAGVGMTPEWTTKQGHEFQFGTNHLGHFLLTYLLLDKLKAAPSGDARIVHVSAKFVLLGNMRFDNLGLTGIYTPSAGYARSKLANVLFNRELAKRLKGSGVNTYACHPGLIRTEFTRHFSKGANRTVDLVGGLLHISLKEGVQTQLYCAFDERVAQETGNYYMNCTVVPNLPDHATDDADAEKLWDLSCKLCGFDSE